MAIGAKNQRGDAIGPIDARPVLQLATIAEVGAAIAGARSCEEVLQRIFSEARWLVNFSRCSLALTTETGLIRVLSQGSANTPPQERLIPRATGGPTAWVLAERQPLVIDNLQATWPGAEAESAILGRAARSALLLPLIVDGGVIGVLVFSATRFQAYPRTVLGITQLLALHVASAVRTSLLLEEVDGQENVILSLALAIEAKDPYTEGHCARLADYALLLGRDLGLPERELAQLRMGAMLHDVGKIAIPETILRKPSGLTDEERVLFREHPVVGERICRPLRSAQAILPAIRHHHERWDGRGYPDGLEGEEIPLMARIVALVDAFDAMVSDRPYRRGVPIADALEIMRANSGPQWDPALVDRFLPLIGQRLTSGWVVPGVRGRTGPLLAVSGE